MDNAVLLTLCYGIFFTVSSIFPGLVQVHPNPAKAGFQDSPWKFFSHLDSHSIALNSTVCPLGVFQSRVEVSFHRGWPRIPTSVSSALQEWLLSPSLRLLLPCSSPVRAHHEGLSMPMGRLCTVSTSLLCSSLSLALSPFKLWLFGGFHHF